MDEMQRLLSIQGRFKSRRRNRRRKRSKVRQMIDMYPSFTAADWFKLARRYKKNRGDGTRISGFFDVFQKIGSVVHNAMGGVLGKDKQKTQEMLAMQKQLMQEQINAQKPAEVEWFKNPMIIGAGALGAILLLKGK